MSDLPLTPEALPARAFTDAETAVDYLCEIYERNTRFLSDAFDHYLAGTLTPSFPDGPAPPVTGAAVGTSAGVKIRACYPQVSFTNPNYSDVDSRLSYGYVIQPGEYATTVTRPQLYRNYLIDQLSLLMSNHGQPVTVAESDIAIPIHFALNPGTSFTPPSDGTQVARMRDIFDVPDIEHVNDYIVNGTYEPTDDLPIPLAPFPAQRVDYSLHRLLHYSATSPHYFQNFVLFTNYQFYVDEFCRLAREMMASGDSPYTAFVEPGDRYTASGESQPSSGVAPEHDPQMPAYHLIADRNRGISLVNIGVGPSNAKTITDHVAVLRPHAWLMLGHCAGLRNSQQLGDYVLAHAYVREDHVLDNDIPVWVPIPALAEIQQALESAVAETTGLSGFDLKKIMRTGTVASIDNRNWELQDHREPVRRLSQSRAIALDMESATIAANGFRLRVPYGTLLCISDKPLQGELKLPGMASRFYHQQVAQHLQIGILALQKLAAMDTEKLHSRKLRSFFETAFQ